MKNKNSKNKIQNFSTHKLVYALKYEPSATGLHLTTLYEFQTWNYPDTYFSSISFRPYLDPFKPCLNSYIFSGGSWSKNLSSFFSYVGSKACTSLLAIFSIQSIGTTVLQDKGVRSLPISMDPPSMLQTQRQIKKCYNIL